MFALARELLADDHPARVVAAFVDGLSAADWAELGVDLHGQALGGPAYHPRALLSIWLYGFMSGTRCARRLEAACREQLPMLWLSGSQQPDHNTLWRFYKQHRERMRGLLQLTVRTARRRRVCRRSCRQRSGSASRSRRRVGSSSSRTAGMPT